MYKVSNAFSALALMLLASLAQAQTAGTVNLSANRTSAQGSLTPVLTWSTSPVASSCRASGGWSGTKFASGSETLPTITTSQTYTLTCSWNGGTATVHWTAPTTNTDGSRITNLAGYKVVFGTSSSALNQSQSVNSATATSATIASLSAGTWYFAVRAVNSSGAESANSSVSQKTVTGASASKSVNITITSGSPPPPPPSSTLKTTSKRVYDVVWSNNVRTRGVQVGTIAIG